LCDDSKIHVRDAFLAALMLTGTIEAAEDDEECERSAVASGNAGLPAWRIMAARNHRVLCGDATSAEAVARLYPPRSHIRTEYLTILATDEQPLVSTRRQSFRKRLR